MSANTVLRNNIVQPFSTRTPLVANKGEHAIGESGVAWPHVKFFQALTNAANTSMQISNVVPAHSNSKGTAGTVVFGPSGILYVCFAPNQWWKFTGASF